MHGDDGIVLRLPDADLLDFPSPDAPSADEAPVGADAALFDPTEIEQLVTDQVGGSALFASRFRECAGRALLLPRRSPGRRTPPGSSASGPPSCWRWPASSAPSRSCWRPSGSASRTSSTCQAWSS